VEDDVLPVKVLNGRPGYINFLDALNSWPLVKELKQVLRLPSAASFKHVSPPGAGVAVPLTNVQRQMYFVDDMELSLLATAYVRARGADRMSSFGDWVALSDVVDVSTAMVLRREVSDGVIAPGYEDEAFDILKQKKGGRYNIVQINPDWYPGDLEKRTVFGVKFEQERNNLVPGFELLQNIVTVNKDLPDSAKRDLAIAMIGVKYTQSNSVCFAYEGQLIGTGAGQMSRIHCVRLAADKADRWFLRQHPKVLEIEFKEGLMRVDKDNALDQYFEDVLTASEQAAWSENFINPPVPLSREAKREWLDSCGGVAVASDAFFPFRDNIDRASRSGVSYLVEPGGSERDDLVIEACNQYGMVMAFSKTRLFNH